MKLRTKGNGGSVIDSQALQMSWTAAVLSSAIESAHYFQEAIRLQHQRAEVEPLAAGNRASQLHIAVGQ